MSKKITQDELENCLWGSAVLLRNHIDAGAYMIRTLMISAFRRQIRSQRRLRHITLRRIKRRQSEEKWPQRVVILLANL